MKATNIEWEIDLEEGEIYEDVIKELGLPAEIEIPSNIDAADEDKVCSWLFDEFGFLIWGFDIEEE